MGERRTERELIGACNEERVPGVLASSLRAQLL